MSEPKNYIKEDFFKVKKLLFKEILFSKVYYFLLWTILQDVISLFKFMKSIKSCKIVQKRKWTRLTY